MLNRLRSSLENIVDVPDEEEPLVTFPDEQSTPSLEMELCTPQSVTAASNELIGNEHMNTTDSVKFEEKRTMSASKTKVIKDGFSREQV